MGRISFQFTFPLIGIRKLLQGMRNVTTHQKDTDQRKDYPYNKRGRKYRAIHIHQKSLLKWAESGLNHRPHKEVPHLFPVMKQGYSLIKCTLTECFRKFLLEGMSNNTTLRAGQQYPK